MTMRKPMRANGHEWMRRHDAKIVCRKVALFANKSSGNKKRHRQLVSFKDRQCNRQIVPIAIVESDRYQVFARICRQSRPQRYYSFSASGEPAHMRFETPRRDIDIRRKWCVERTDRVVHKCLMHLLPLIKRHKTPRFPALTVSRTKGSSGFAKAYS